MPSFGARLFVFVLKLSGRKKVLTSVATLDQGIAAARRQGPALPSAAMRKVLQVSVESVNGHDVYTLAPLAPKTSARRVLYLHGGAFVRPITSTHWRFLQAIVMATDCTVTVPLYPLAPEHAGLSALEFTLQVYRRMMVAGESSNLTLMGDSAGGGIAIALALALRDRDLALPAQLIAISPVIDAALNNPKIEATAANDPILSVVGLREAFRRYAGDLPLTHPYISPLHADTAKLPRMTIFVGTHDVLCHDALLFAEKAKQQGNDVTLVVAPEMMHDWPIMPFAEGVAARATIIELIRGIAS